MMVRSDRVHLRVPCFQLDPFRPKISLENQQLLTPRMVVGGKRRVGADLEELPFAPQFGVAPEEAELDARDPGAGRGCAGRHRS